MERSVQQSLIIVFKKFIEHLKKGYCDNLTDDEYDKILHTLLVLNEIEKQIYERNCPNNSVNWWTKCRNRFRSVL